MSLAARAFAVGIDGWRVLNADPSDRLVWEAILHRAEHDQHLRMKSQAALIARAVWGKG